MDPLTHALLGATVAQAALGPRLGRRAWLVGALGGVLPDADILIGSATDPLLAIEYHRQFTHAFAFVPVGGLLTATPWLAQRRHRGDAPAIFAAGCLGYATHGLLDACTNYGTHLLWPFSPLRVAWHWMTTVGPLLTLALLLGLVFAVRGRTRGPAVAALVFALAYVGAAALQRERALDVQAQVAAARGHAVERAEMFPTVGNPFVWRSVYESGKTLYTDRVRMLGDAATRWKTGGTVALVDIADLTPAAQADARVRRDFARFAVFSAGWVARAGDDAEVIGDARYSLRTDAFMPIWGVRFRPGQPQPTEWADRTAQNRIPAGDLWREMTGAMPGYGPAPRAGG